MQLPIKMPSLPSYRASVDASATAENLKAVASSTDDPEILLGLAFYAKAGDPVRYELGERALLHRNEYAPILAALFLMMDGIDEATVNELLRRDPDNALGPYLHGTLLHISDRDGEGLEAFRKAAAFSHLRLYDSIIGQALFRALDALGLEGLDRLCALSWTVSRWNNFSSLGIQPIHRALSELARGADAMTRSELAEILLSLGGHLFATNFVNRWFARQAVQSAFFLKAECATERAPVMNGYAAAIQGLTNAMLPGSSVEEAMTPNLLQLAQFLPGRIHRAFAAADPAMMNGRFLGELNINPPECDRATFATAKENATHAARKLIEAAMTDPDGILGAYLQSLPTSAQNPPWASFGTPVGSLLESRPELFKAAAANEEAMNALIPIWRNDSAVKNTTRMMEIAWALQCYAQKHDLTYPDRIATLFESGELKSTLVPESLLTARPFIYVAAGERSPAKSNEQAMFVLLYDDEPDQYGCYPCVFASCIGSHIQPDDLRAHLAKRGK